MRNDLFVLAAVFCALLFRPAAAQQALDLRCDQIAGGTEYVQIALKLREDGRAVIGLNRKTQNIYSYYLMAGSFKKSPLGDLYEFRSQRAEFLGFSDDTIKKGSSDWEVGAILAQSKYAKKLMVFAFHDPAKVRSDPAAFGGLKMDKPYDAVVEQLRSTDLKVGDRTFYGCNLGR